MKSVCSKNDLVISEFDIGSLRNFYDVYYASGGKYSLAYKCISSDGYKTDWHVKTCMVI